MCLKSHHTPLFVLPLLVTLRVRGVLLHALTDATSLDGAALGGILVLYFQITRFPICVSVRECG